MYVTRIAPSPTGDMHLGTARTAYFNWLAARASGGKFILRIDDTDKKRSDPAYTKVILDTMKWLGLDYDSVVTQSDRFDLYKKKADLLIQEGWADIKDGAVVFKMNPDHVFMQDWTDEISGKIRITQDDKNNLDGRILIKSDGSPSYNFSSVVDDLDLGVNFVIRGIDHLTNTAVQVMLWDILNSGQKLPKFAHLGLICFGNKPMSKRDGDFSMVSYINAGYDPDAMLNFLARMGWGPAKDDKTTTLLPRDKMLQMFLTAGRMKSGSAGFDKNKLESFDRKYKAQKGIWRNRDVLQ